MSDHLHAESKCAEKQIDYWSNTYRGHRVEVTRDHTGWVVTIDHDVQKGLDFETAEEAAAWLHRRVDARIAEAIFPGLAHR